MLATAGSSDAVLLTVPPAGNHCLGIRDRKLPMLQSLAVDQSAVRAGFPDASDVQVGDVLHDFRVGAENISRSRRKKARW